MSALMIRGFLRAPLSLLVTTLLLWGSVPAAVGQDVTFWDDTLIDCNDLTYEGYDVVVDGCTVTINCAHAFNSLSVINGGAVTHSPCPNGGQLTLDLTVTGDVIVDPSSAITAGGKGYGSSSGPGAGGDSDFGGGGGGYGGAGGDGWPDGLGGAAYGSITAPTDLGSGGGMAYVYPGGAGGGAIRLVVDGTLTVDGELTANGLEGASTAGQGSGGSIYLVVGTLSGVGNILAEGCDSPTWGGGGGGGRIAIEFGLDAFTGTISACGGQGSNPGGAGTIFTKSIAQQWGDLLIDNCENPGTVALTPITSLTTLDSLTIAGNAVAEAPAALTASDLQVGTAGRLTYPEEQVTELVLLGDAMIGGGGSIWANVDLTVEGDLLIDPNSAITADGKGYGSSSGPGAGGDGLLGGGGGGGYGGAGGPAGGAGGPTYGSITEPTDLGSGGGMGYSNPGGAGGGAIRLVVDGTLTVNGSLTASGEDGQWVSGGGSGGSIYLSVGTLTGGGDILANGGASGGGGGGGGRIAIYHFDASGFGGEPHVEGGSGGENGEPGTVYLYWHEEPHVLSHTPDGLVGQSIDHVDVRFDEPLNGVTFTTDDIALLDPSGVEIPITSDPAPLGSNWWRIAFDPQWTEGEYHAYVGPHIEDLDGHEMNQDGDQIAGEDPSDVYDASFTVVHVEELALGVAVPSDFTDALRARYFKVTVPGSKDLEIGLDGLDDEGANELYARFEEIPTRTEFDFRYGVDPSADQTVRIPGTRTGTYYILAYGRDIPDPEPSSFSIIADYLPLSVTQVTPDLGYSAVSSPWPLTIQGTGFDPEATVILCRSGQTDIPAADIAWIDTGTISATLNLYGQESGGWEVVVTNPNAQSASYPFTVLTSGVWGLTTELILPGALGYHTPATLYIDYEYTGSVPMPAPVLELHGTQDALLTADESLAGPGLWTENPPPGLTDTVQVRALGSDPDPTLLKPGDSGRIIVYYRGCKMPWDFSYPPIEFTLSALTGDDARPIDWEELKEELRPEYMDPGAWDAIWTNVVNQVGWVWGAYVNMLTDNAVYLSGLGQDVADVGSLFAFELVQAAALSPHRSLAAAVDAYAPAPGMPLVFTRVFGQTIDSRYELGPLGRGWTHNWDVYVRELSDGNVFIHGPNGNNRFFTNNGDGTFDAPPAEYGTLTTDGSAFRLQEKDGIAWQFRTDNRLDYLEDTNGNRVTCGYAGDLLTSLSHSCGLSFSLTYNGDARVEQLTDSVGRDTQYAYNGEHLDTVTAPGNRLTAYNYEATGPLPRQHALLSVAYPGGTHDYFTYDDSGRLTQRNRDGGAEAVTYTYDSAGTVTVEDASGRQTILSFGLGGRLLRAVDGESNPVNLSYDPTGRLAGVIGAQSEQYDYAYDPRGNVTSIADPLGHVTSFIYRSSDSRLTSVIDANGHGTEYGYDSAGNVTSITYEDESVEYFTYDPNDGMLETWTNRRGDTVTYTHNANGQVLTKDYSDTPGYVDFEYEYNAAGNLTAATNAAGTIMMAYDANTDWLTRIDYPGGRFFTFEYDDAGRRTRRVGHDGYELLYAYDDAGRLDVMTNGLAELIADYDYDSAGRLARTTLGNGVYATYEYDDAGRLTGLHNCRPDKSVLSRFLYTYGASGRRTSMTTLDRTYIYGYDDDGQLTSVTYPDTYVVTYTYDPLGNRIEVDDSGSMTAYTTNEMNRYTAVGAVTYTYDTDGNMISKTEGGITTIYEYDPESRLIGMTTPQDVWAYTYDALGNCLSTIHDGVETQHMIDPVGHGHVVAEYEGAGTLLARYSHGLGLLERRNAANAVYCYTFDGVGNTSELTDDTAQAVNTYTYDPFGRDMGMFETVPNPFEFVGEYGVMQDESGPGYMRARVYDCSVGRFVSEDPIGLAGGDINLYAYVRNNPVNRIDPTGTLSPMALPSTILWELILRYVAVDGIYGGYGGYYRDGSQVKEEEYESLPRQQQAYVRHDRIFRPGGLNCWHIWKPAVREGHADLIRSTFYNNASSLREGVERIRAGVRSALRLLGVTVTQWVNLNLRLSDLVALMSRLVGSVDPNDKLGPSGFGEAGFVPADRPMDYTVRFENDPNATAAARRVFVTDQLDDELDWGSFEFGGVAFGEQVFTVPPGLTHYETSMAVDGWTWNSQDGWHTGETPLIVDIVVDLDIGAGLVTWSIDAYDPSTGWPPSDPYAGFLPPDDPNDITHRGEGELYCVVAPNSGLPTGTEITNEAMIVFDYNPEIPTPIVLNTIDADSPTSSVTELPPATYETPFTVTWISDDGAGSGAAQYDVYISVDGGPFALWVSTSETSASLNGQRGRTYALYSVATDGVGNVEDPPIEADATTVVWLRGPGDIDGDGDIDVDDFAGFADCMAGPYNTPTPTWPDITEEHCLDAFDFERDYDVDLGDFVEFQ